MNDLALKLGGFCFPTSESPAVGLYKLRGTDLWHMREPHWEWTAPLNPQLALALYDNHTPVAVVRCFGGLRLQSQSIDLGCVGLGGVWVEPAYRGKGWGDRLLHAALWKLRAYDEHVAVLYARARSLYTRNGFQPLARSLGDRTLWATSLIPSIRFDHHGRHEWELHPRGHF